jgi:hypothetical protein
MYVVEGQAPPHCYVDELSKRKLESYIGAEDRGLPLLDKAGHSSVLVCEHAYMYHVCRHEIYSARQGVGSADCGDPEYGGT